MCSLPDRTSVGRAALRDSPCRAGGFTLIELLVTLAIIAILVSLLVPAIQQVRETARRTQCKANLKQIGLALQNYAEAHRVYPPSACISAAGSWSIHARLMPYVEQAGPYSEIHLDLDWSDPVNQATGVSQLQVPVYFCPSDPNGQTLYEAGDEEGISHPVNYGFNCGTWFVFDPSRNQGGDGCFYPNSNLTAGHIMDGLSNTLAAAEVRAFQPVFRNTSAPSSTPPANASYLSTLAGAAYFELGPSLNDNGGHSEWCDGTTHETGFTTVFTPNTYVSYVHSDGRTYDIDFNSREEGTSRTLSTYAAVTSRSYHSGIVNVLLMDGSVRAVGSSISLYVWRSLGTRALAEVVAEQ